MLASQSSLAERKYKASFMIYKVFDPQTRVKNDQGETMPKEYNLIEAPKKPKAPKKDKLSQHQEAVKAKDAGLY